MRAAAASLIALLLLAPGTARADGPPSPVVFPAQSLPMSFSHAQHLRLGDVGCGTCHEEAAASLRAGDRLLPAESACAACHEIDRSQPEKQASPPARCDACHQGYQAGVNERIAALDIPPPNLRFNHKIHVDEKMRCVDCHKVTDVNL